VAVEGADGGGRVGRVVRFAVAAGGGPGAGGVGGVDEACSRALSELLQLPAESNGRCRLLGGGAFFLPHASVLLAGFAAPAPAPAAKVARTAAAAAPTPAPGRTAAASNASNVGSSA
jgi:hypothetical protein